RIEFGKRLILERIGGHDAPGRIEPAIFIDLESRGAGQQLPFSAGPRRATRTSSTCRSLVVTTSTPVATWASLANRYSSVVAASGTLVMATLLARAMLPTNRQELL